MEQVKEFQAEAGESERNDGRRGMLWWVIGLAVAIVVYVLSIGPVMKLDQKVHPPYGSSPIVQKVYWPLWALSGRVRPMNRALSWYVFEVCRVRLWVVPD